MPGTVQQNLTAGGAFSNLAAIFERWDRRMSRPRFLSYARGAGYAGASQRSYSELVPST